MKRILFIVFGLVFWMGGMRAAQETSAAEITPQPHQWCFELAKEQYKPYLTAPDALKVILYLNVVCIEYAKGYGLDGNDEIEYLLWQALINNEEFAMTRWLGVVSHQYPRMYLQRTGEVPSGVEGCLLLPAFAVVAVHMYQIAQGESPSQAVTVGVAYASMAAYLLAQGYHGYKKNIAWREFKDSKKTYREELARALNKSIAGVSKLSEVNTLMWQFYQQISDQTWHASLEWLINGLGEADGKKAEMFNCILKRLSERKPLFDEQAEQIIAHPKYTVEKSICGLTQSSSWAFWRRDFSGCVYVQPSVQAKIMLAIMAGKIVVPAASALK